MLFCYIRNNLINALGFFDADKLKLNRSKRQRGDSDSFSNAFARRKVIRRESMPDCVATCTRTLRPSDTIYINPATR
jgi:hypothetical protein